MEQIALLISFIRRYAGFWKEGGGGVLPPRILIFDISYRFCRANSKDFDHIIYKYATILSTF